MPKIGRITSYVRVRARRLLNMDYKPAEIAEELETTAGAIRGYLKAGCPARYDKTGHAWINGTEFAKWIKKHAPTKKHETIEYGPLDFYCLQCKEPVKAEKITGRRKKGRVTLISAVCPLGHRMTKITSKDSEDPENGKP